MTSIIAAASRLLSHVTRHIPILDERHFQWAARSAIRECMKDPAFRAELANWVSVNSPEGQDILASFGA